MYDLIYNFLIDNFFTDTTLNSFESTILNQTINLNEWLAHTFSIISIGLLFVFCVLFIKWFFRLGAGLLTFR